VLSPDYARLRAELERHGGTVEKFIGDALLRIAVATGEALVTLGARPSEGEGIAAGDVVNTAARLQSRAGPRMPARAA
jgi:class 3 adenylate cyclase